MVEKNTILVLLILIALLSIASTAITGQFIGKKQSIQEEMGEQQVIEVTEAPTAPAEETQPAQPEEQINAPETPPEENQSIEELPLQGNTIGILSLTVGWNYQEDANATGNTSGTWTNFANVENVRDGDWNTFGDDIGGIGGSAESYAYFNYTKPAGSRNARWQIKDNGTTTNLTVPNTCFNQSPVQFSVRSSHFTTPVLSKSVNWTCWNGAAWQELRTLSGSTFEDQVYEEAVWWNMTSNIDTCSNLTESDTTYYLDANLSKCQGLGSSSDKCIFINGSNITLDCAGYSFISNNSDQCEYGIYVINAQNVTLKNCTIANYSSTGIYVRYSNNVNVLDSNMRFSGRAGLSVFDSTNVNATNLDIRSGRFLSENFAGLFLSDSNNIVLNSINLTDNVIDLRTHNATGTIARNVTFNQTRTSFTYSGDFRISYSNSSEIFPTAQPSGIGNISMYLNITNQSSGGWMFLNVSYNQSALSGIGESTLKLWRHHAEWVYEESGDGTPDCGPLQWNNEGNVYDGNWNSFGDTQGSFNSYCDIDYTKPANVYNSSRWQFKDGLGTNNLSNMFTTYTFSDPNCWQQNPLKFRVVSALGDMAYWQCYNGTSYIMQFNSSGSGANDVYEEAMFWDTRYWTRNLAIEAQEEGVNTVDNYVYASISQFGGIFAPMGEYVTDVSDCQNLTTSNATYILINNLDGAQATKRCIDIQANNITLDCAGKNITNALITNAIGIYAANRNNVTIKNCNVYDYTYGIQFSASSNSSLLNNTVIRNSVGINLTSASNNNNLTNNTANSNDQVGIYITSSSNNNTLTNNNASLNQYGFYIVSSSKYNLLTNNNVSINTNCGIRIDISSTYNTLINNNADLNTNCGIMTYSNSDYTTLINNTANSNTNYGIQLNSKYNNLTNNTANSNSGYGFYLDTVSGNNTLTNNTANSNLNSGIILSTSSFNNLTGNIANNNQGIYGGIFIYQSSNNNILTNNNASFNDIWDFFSVAGNLNNRIINLTTDTTVSSFTYSGDFYLKSATAPAGGNPAGYTSLNKYLNITNATASAWVYLNISYTDAELSGLSESTLRIWKNSLGGWNQKLNKTGILVSGVNNDSNYVYANISNFSSIFAPMGELGSMDNCRDIIVGDNVYTLTQNLVGNLSNGICINISANNVTLDCAGKNITGNESGITYGIYIDGYNNITITNCTISSYTRGIWLNASSNSNITNNTLYNNSLYGIFLQRDSNSNTLTNNNAGTNQYGIYLYTASNNILTDNIAYNNTNVGIYLGTSSNNNTLTNNTANSNNYGILVTTSLNNTFINNNASFNAIWDFYSFSSSNNTITNLTTNNTKSSFTYSGDIFLKSATAPAGGDPIGYSNIGKYINITNETAGAWIYLNISYTDSDLAGIRESSLRIWKNSSGGWNQNVNLSGVRDAANYGVNTANYYVYANISNFSSIFAPMGVSTTEIEIRGCMNLTTADGVYVLTKDLTGVQTSNKCIEFTADTITLNCDNHNLTGSSVGNTYGIYASARNNITIQNCSVYDYGFGIYLDSSSNSSITNNTANSNTNYGITLESNSNNNTLTNNTADFNSIGTYFGSSSNDNILANNIFDSNTNRGIVLDSSSNNSLINNTIYSSNYGIYLRSASNSNNLTNNTVVSNNDNGIYLDSSSNNILANNNASSNTNYGIYFISASNNNILTNNIANSNSYGIYIDSSSNSNLSNNNASSNQYGVYITSSNNNSLINNTANSNTNYGIYMYSSPNSSLTNNTANLNNNGVYISSSNYNNLMNNTVNFNSNDGISFILSNNNTLTSSTVYSNGNYGVYLLGSSNNTISNNNVSLNYWDFYSSHSDGEGPIFSTGNRIINLTTNDTVSSFIYNGSIHLKSATAPLSGDPIGYQNINHYLRIENGTDAWIDLNISYQNSDIPASISDKSSIKIWTHDIDAYNYTYQEDANATGSSGSWTNITNVSDGDWSTYGISSSSLAYYYANYSKPTRASAEDSLWQVEYNNDGGTYNISLPIECWNQDVLQFRVISDYDTGAVDWDCYNGSSYQNLAEDAGYVYEEAMYWVFVEWTDAVGTPNAIDEINKVVNANITKFGSIFAPMGSTNSAPNTTTPTIDPATAYTNDDLYCNATLEDMQDDPITAYWTWYKNDVANLSGSISVSNATNSNITVLLNGNTTTGENWICEVTPFDGTLNGTAKNSTKTIQDFISTVSTFSVNDTNHNINAKYSANVTDTDTISGCIIEHNNSGSFVNTTFLALSGLSDWCNFTILNNNTNNVNITWSVWANDSLGAWTHSANYSFLTTNTAPTSTAPTLNTTIPYTNERIQCDNSSFTDFNSDTAVWYYMWYDSGVPISGQTSNTLDLTISGLDKGDTIICSTMAGDSFDNETFGWRNSSVSATIQNSVLTISQELIFTNASTGHSFNVSAKATDADGASDIVNSNISTTSGSCVRISFTTVGSDKEAIYNCTGTALQSTTIKISFNDSSNTYATTAAASNAYPNNVPSISSVDVTPDSPNTSSVLTCTPSGWTDADGDSAIYYYKWFDDDTGIVSGQISSTFDCGSVSNCDKGDSITCEVTPSDSYVNGTAVNGSEIIENTAPTLTTLSVATNPIKGGMQQKIDATDPDDADADSLSLYCCNDTSDTCTPSLLVDTWASTYTGMNWTYNAPLLGFANISVRCLVSDGTANSSIVSKNYTEDDNAPSITFYTPPTPLDGSRNIANSVTIKANVTNDLTISTCIINFDGINYTMTTEGSGSSINCSYTNSSLIDGVTYTYKVYANDSVNNFAISSSRNFVENSKPVSTIPTIAPASPVTTNNLDCNATLTDSEDSPLTANWTWYKNGIVNITGQTTGITSGVNSVVSTLLASNTTKGENWSCSIIPYDGYEYGTQQNSSNTTIQNAAPTIPSLNSITPDPAYKMSTLSSTVSSASTDADSDTIYYYYQWSNDSGFSHIIIEGFNSTPTTFTLNCASYTECRSGKTMYLQIKAVTSDANSTTYSSSVSRLISDSAAVFDTFNVNDTNHNINAKYSANVSDNDTLSGCMIEHNNSGSFANTSFTLLGGTTAWCNITILNNNTNNANITWSVWTNDSIGTWNISLLQIFDTTNTIPVLTSVSTNVTNATYDELISLNTTGAWDYNSDGLILECGYSGGAIDACVGSYGAPERTCILNWPHDDFLNHTLYCRVNDSYGVSSPDYEFNITSHTYVMDLDVTTPSNNSYINHSDVWFNITSNKNASACLISIDSSANSTMSNTTRVDWNNYTTGLSEGQHNATFWCNKSFDGSENTSETVYFIIDTIAPIIDLTAPTDGATFTSSTVTIRAVADEIVLTCIAGIDDSTNVTMTNSSGDWNVDATFTDGLHTVKVYCSDLAGNWNSSDSASFTISVPVITDGGGGGGASSGLRPNITVIEIIDKQGFFVYMNNLVPNVNYKFPYSWPSDLRIDSMSFNDYVNYQTFVANKKDSLSMTAPTENVYQYYTFDNSKLNVTATKVEFQFRTPIIWLESTEAKVQNMRLYVYDKITWHELSTDVYEVNGTHIVFNSTDTALYDAYAIAESGAKLKEITFLQVIYSIEKYYNGEIGFIDVLSTISDYYMQKI